MPRLPSKQIRPWQIKPKPQEGRTYKALTYDGKPFYQSQDWRRVRKQQLDRQKFCEICLSQHILTEANTVDHIIQIKENPDLSLELSNLRSLCSSCHNKISGQQAHKKR